MVQIKEDKSKLKNWEIGDTFAIKIENTDTEYDGQYIILIKCEKEEHVKICPRTINEPYFYVKITNNFTIPKNITELNELEFIKIDFITWNWRFFPLNGIETLSEAKKRIKKTKLFPDEYKYLYSYIIQIWIKRGTKHNFQYLGNYNIKLPKEFINSTPRFTLYQDNETFIKELLNLYNDYNLRKGYPYTEEGIKTIQKNDDLQFKILQNEEKYINEYRKTGKFSSKEKIQKDIEKLHDEN